MEYADTFSEKLKTYLKDNQGKTKASRKSDVDIKSVSTSASGVLQNGKMYAFNYFPKVASFFDSYPIVIGLGRSDYGNQLGLNLHYIPYKFRVSFLEDLTKSLQSFLAQQLKGARVNNPSIQAANTSLTWDNLNSAFKNKYNLKSAVRQYDMTSMSSVRCIGYENWHLGAIHNENYFVGGTIGQAQSLYYKNI